MELKRFDKAVSGCREFLRENIRAAGQLTITVTFEGGRITHLQKNFVDDLPNT